MGKNALHPFPVLKSNPHKIANADEYEKFPGGKGTIAEPFIVKTLEQLENIKDYPFANFILENDIIFKDNYNWLAINDFCGTIDGNGHALVNMVSRNSSEDECAGFINDLKGYVFDLSVENASISDSYISGSSTNSIGGIAGCVRGKVVGCSFSISRISL